MMKPRCFNPKATSYQRYGGAGITVCERWRAFENFISDMGAAPSSRHSLDRWPNRLGDDEPGNVRWATQKEQIANTRPPQRKLRVEQVVEIRQLIGTMAHTAIAKSHDVSRVTISDIALGRRWKGR